MRSSMRSSFAGALMDWNATSRRSGKRTTIIAPESAQSFRVFSGFFASVLSGIVLMAMELFSIDDEAVADFAPDQQDGHLFVRHIIERPEAARPQLELGEGVGPELLHGP